MRNATAALFSLVEYNFARCKRFGCLSPALVLRALRDVARRQHAAEPLPPTVHLLGYSSDAYGQLDALAFALQCAVVFGGNAGLFGGKTNKEVSDKYKTLVTPAGWAFAIWGIIYFWELGAVFYILATPASHLLADCSSWWIVGSALQALWSLAFAYEQTSLAAVLLTGIAACFCECGRVLASGEAAGLDWLLVLLPVSLHAGWACAATLVGWNLAAVARGATVPVQICLAFASLYAATLLAMMAVLATLFAVPVTFPLAVAWALAAIAQEVDLHGGEVYPWQVRLAVAYTAQIGAVVVASTAVTHCVLAIGCKNAVPVSFS
ncbi:hypothetical protein T492DRAFT_1096982 [Pavlovales sp. CCMP2436]|nr:hypothetical protein T492DRAFT_1096982 [Pavlovales sp. CCMP2436]